MGAVTAATSGQLNLQRLLAMACQLRADAMSHNLPGDELWLCSAARDTLLQLFKREGLLPYLAPLGSWEQLLGLRIVVREYVPRNTAVLVANRPGELPPFAVVGSCGWTPRGAARQPSE